MHDLLNKRIKEVGTWTINGANTVSWDPGHTVEVTRIILVYTTGNTTAKNTVTAQRRPVSGAASAQVTLGTFDTTVTTAAGDVDSLPVGIDIAAAAPSPDDGSIVAVARTKWTIYPGQDFALVSDGGGTAGVCNVFIEYVSYPWGNAEGAAGVLRTLTQAT